MSVATEISKLSANISAAYQAIADKGGQVPEAKTASALSAAIRSINKTFAELPSYQVDANGKATSRSCDITNSFENIKTIGSKGMSEVFYDCTGLTGQINFPNLQKVENNGLYYCFSGCGNLTGTVNLSSCTEVGYEGLRGMCHSCSKLTSANFHSLKTIGQYGLQYAFVYCYGLTSVDLSSLETIGDNGMDWAFNCCNKIQGVRFDSLKQIGPKGMYCAFGSNGSMGYVEFPVLTTVKASGLESAFTYGKMTRVSFPELSSVESFAFNSTFNGCSMLSSVSFPKLKTLPDNANSRVFHNAFNGCSSLLSVEFEALESVTGGQVSSCATFGNMNKTTDVYFPKLSSIANTYLFDDRCAALSGIHFASANREAIEGAEGFPTLWGRGAGQATVYFDL